MMHRELSPSLIAYYLYARANDYLEKAHEDAVTFWDVHQPDPWVANLPPGVWFPIRGIVTLGRSLRPPKKRPSAGRSI